MTIDSRNHRKKVLNNREEKSCKKKIPKHNKDPAEISLMMENSF